MPHVIVKMWPGKSKAKKKNAEEVTRALPRHFIWRRSRLGRDRGSGLTTLDRQGLQPGDYRQIKSRGTVHHDKRSATILTHAVA
jgi:hypothetical protein